MTTAKGYKRYSPEFKREALKRASEDGNTDKSVCSELGISPRQLARWRDEFRLMGDDAFLGKSKNPNDEIAKLKRELANVKKERDFLKQAVVFFAKESE